MEHMGDYEEIRHLDIKRRYFHISRLGRTLWSLRDLLVGIGGTVVWIAAWFSLGLSGVAPSLISPSVSGALALVLIPLPFLVCVIYAISRTGWRTREVVNGFAELVTESGVYVGDGSGRMTRRR